MTEQAGTPGQNPGDPTVPLVPDGGYTQPAVPPLEETGWPDFSYDDAAGRTSLDTNETTVDFGAPAPAHTAPLPSLDPQAGLAYQQPVQRAPQAGPYGPGPAMYQPVSVAPQPAGGRFETYQPYTPPVPAPYTYPVAPTATAPEHPSAVTSLVLGILGVFVLPILAPIAWAVAGKARREMGQYPGRWAPSGTLTAGYVLGIIGTLLWGTLVAIIMFVMMIAVASFS